jgi:hypothetical protein
MCAAGLGAMWDNLHVVQDINDILQWRAYAFWMIMTVNWNKFFNRLWMMDKLPTLIMETGGPSETSVHFYQITQRQIPKYSNLHSHRSTNHGPHEILWFTTFSHNKTFWYNQYSE